MKSKVPLETYLANAEHLAQEVVNAWGLNVDAGNSSYLTPEFNRLLDRACSFRSAKGIADNHREFNLLSERVATEETASRTAFAEEFKIFDERHVA